MTSASAGVPAGIAGLDPQWLTEALRADATISDGVVVTGVTAEQIALDSGFSSRLYRLHLTGSPGLPATVIAKLPALSEARGAMELLGGYRRELSFYRNVAGRAPIGTPHVYAARIAANGVDFVLLLEDLRAWDNADHLAGLTMERALICMSQLAGLHRWSLAEPNQDVLQYFPSFDNSAVRELLVPAFALGWEVYREHATVPVPGRVARFAERFADHAPVALRALTERSMLLHGDIRADNMFFDSDRLKIVDFQFAAVGCGATDVAYLVSQGLPVDVRRGHDEWLVAEYVRLLGVPDYSFGEAWRHYRLAVAYLMVLPVITLIGWDGLPERSRALCLTLTDRATAAISEIGALEEFG